MPETFRSPGDFGIFWLESSGGGRWLKCNFKLISVVQSFIIKDSRLRGY
jgi:hypothetical protein